MASSRSSLSTDQLFACTNCHVKVRLEELSSIQQLCKSCRKLFPLCQCRFCKLEYHRLSGENSKACKSCNASYKQHGEPKRCGYCTQQAAFQGNLCPRCQHSERKYGTPIFCDQCKLKCAFSQPLEKKEKVDGKTLCLLCTMEYKKARHREMKRQKDSNEGKMNASSSQSKKPKLETSNGEQLEYMSMRSTTSDTVGTDHIVVVENLKEQVSNLKKQLGEKDRVILEKEKKIGELQGDLWKKDREFRVKLQQAQKENAAEVESLQSTIRELRRQISQGVKSNRSIGKSKSSRVAESTAEVADKETEPVVPHKNDSPEDDPSSED